MAHRQIAFPRRSWKVMLLIVLAVFCVVIVGAELAARNSNYRYLLGSSSFLPRYHTQISATHYDIRPDYPPTPVHFPEGDFEAWSNSFGCFDEPVNLGTTTPYAYLTGGSFTWGKVALEKSWGAVLENSLATRVLKCGVNGYGTRDEFLKTERDLASLHSPELIVVGYFASDPLMDQRALGEAAQDECSSFLARFSCFVQDNWMSQHSVLYSMFLGVMRDELRSLSQYAISDEMYAAHFENVDALVRLAESKSSPILFVFIPKESHLAKQSTTVYDRTREHLKSAGVPYIDLAERMRPLHHEGARLYWRFDSQWNGEGNRLAGLLVAEHILSNNLVDIPGKEERLTQVREGIASFISSLE